MKLRLNLLFAAMLSLAATAAMAASAPDAATLAKGHSLFENNCSACHQAHGEGMPGVFPNLAKSDFLAADPQRAVHFVLHGHTGQITVNGVTYDGSMPDVGANLSNQDVADILTYVLNSWGNPGGEIQPDAVAQIRSGGSQGGSGASEGGSQK
jgi:nitrite reductase (NO-forming)